MKKYIIIVTVVILLFLAADFMWFRLGWYIDFTPKKSVTSFVKTDGENIVLNKDGKDEIFFIKGVDIGSSVPGKWSTEYDIDEETYLRWFGEISEMGANTVRIYSVYSDSFYNAFYEYNKDNDNPLYLIQGTCIDDYTLNSRLSGTDEAFCEKLAQNSIIAVDVIHGRRKLTLSKKGVYGQGTFTKDVSPWVIGYIIGSNWEPTTVAYTNEMYGHLEEYTSFEGEYMSAKEGSRPFEVVLAQVGNEVLEYESRKYKTQRLIAFSNYAITDPFEYNNEIQKYFTKVDCIDVENIVCTDKVVSGHFASYHVYPYFPDMLRYYDDWSNVGISKDDFVSSDGSVNTYRAYLTALEKHHSIPVVVAEFGTSTARTMYYQDVNTARNAGQMTEKEQGDVLVKCYDDIVASGMAGACVFSWNDEWCKRTWNTMHAVDLRRSAYWSDFQTGEQFFGLLTFDPGKEKSVCYVDGDSSEWTDDDVLIAGDTELSVKYDEKFMYFLVKKDNYDFENETLYIPLDVTPKSGSNYCKNHNIKFDRDADFVIVINGSENSRMLVHERYDALRSTYSNIVYKYNTYQKERIPEINSPEFVPINLLLEKVKYEDVFKGENFVMEMQAQGKEEILKEWKKPVLFETGKLRCGNANPESEDFDSIADFCAGTDFVEIRIPWQMMNFSDPSRMEIHDDYYDGNYGVKYMEIDEMYIGVNGNYTGKRIAFEKLKLKGWGNKPTYHERLKESYYVMQKLWS